MKDSDIQQLLDNMVTDYRKNNEAIGRFLWWTQAREECLRNGTIGFFVPGTNTLIGEYKLNPGGEFPPQFLKRYEGKVIVKSGGGATLATVEGDL